MKAYKRIGIKKIGWIAHGQITYKVQKTIRWLLWRIFDNKISMWPYVKKRSYNYKQKYLNCSHKCTHTNIHTHKVA